MENIFPLKTKILALHGQGSSSTVTELQLHNLGLTGPEFAITYLNGPRLAEGPGPGVAALAEWVAGPWHSWLPPAQDGDCDGRALRRALCEAVCTVLAAVEAHGPFDGIYGFSQGGLVASLVNGLPLDDALAAALAEHGGRDYSHLFREHRLFDGVVIACAGASAALAALRERAGLGEAPSEFPPSQVLHLIGRTDAYKPWSEALALASDPRTTTVIYLPGGHEIARLRPEDAETADIVRRCLRGEDVTRRARPVPGRDGWQASSARSVRSMAGDVQIAAVRSDMDGLPDTILGLLAAQPAEAPLLRHAREADAALCTTYGQLLAFCRPGGDGDLRRLGVRAGEVVAYLAPPGGNATAAAAFLSIAAQTCAVPFRRD